MKELIVIGKINAAKKVSSTQKVLHKFCGCLTINK